MKKILTLAIVILVSMSVQMIIFLPWWSFLVPVFLLGVALPLEKWKVSSPFLVGFIAGLLVWSLSTLYFEATYKGEIINKISEMITVQYYFMDIIIMYTIIGLIGGVLTGLAFYSGFLLRKGREVLHLELPEK